MHNHLRLTALTLITSLALTACASQPPKSLIDIQAGEVFVLNQVIILAPGHTRGFIQFGKLTGSHFNHSEQHCRIEVNNLSEQPQAIKPDHFVITHVNVDEEMIALQNLPTQLAMNNSINSAIMSDVVSAQMLALGGGYERPETMDLVHLYLHSKQQPNVYRLTCSGSLSNGTLAVAPRSLRPQRQQIEKILGEIGHIEPQ